MMLYGQEPSPSLSPRTCPVSWFTTCRRVSPPALMSSPRNHTLYQVYSVRPYGPDQDGPAGAAQLVPPQAAGAVEITSSTWYSISTSFLVGTVPELRLR